MEGVLKIGGADDYGFDIFVFVEFVVVACEGDLLAGEFVDVGGAFFATAAPNVRESDEFKIEF